MEDDLTIRGNLEDSTIPELLRSLCKNKESGVLNCSTRHRKCIFIDKGQIVFATSTSQDERLGEFLLRTGRITVRSFLDATKNIRPGIKFGAILCENGLLTAEELVEGIRDQVRTIVLSLFESVNGTYELVLKPVDTQEMILLNTPTEDIIFQGVKCITSWSRISKGIGSFASVLLPAADSEKVLLNVTLKPEESHLFSLCEKGVFTVEDVCGMSYVSNFETCRILWAFLLIGALEIQDAAVSGEMQRYVPSSADLEADLHDLVEQYNDVYSHIFDYTQGKVGEDVEKVVDRAMIQVHGTMPNVTRNLSLDTYGRLDFDALLKNLTPIPETGRMELVSAALEEIVLALLSEVGALFGTADQTRLSQEVQHLRRV